MNLIFLGPPGAGKGTLSTLAKEAFSLPHLSTGDLFRAAVKAGTPLGLQVKAIMESGGLVPDELTIGIVKEKLAQPDMKNGYILDGFPRTVAQAEALGTFSKIDRVVNFNLEETELVRRLSGRRVCKVCGATYHVETLPPKKAGVCDACGGELYTRKDDMPESIAQRLKEYNSKTQPLIDFYAQKGLMLDLDSAPAPEVILENLKKALKK